MSTLEAEREIKAELALGDELAKYAGEWVAVNEHHVVLHAHSLTELRDQIEEEAEIEGIFQVPDGGYACFF